MTRERGAGLYDGPARVPAGWMDVLRELTAIGEGLRAAGLRWRGWYATEEEAARMEPPPQPQDAWIQGAALDAAGTLCIQLSVGPQRRRIELDATIRGK